ncbi:hypothetical protein [Veronia pacifica]|nr:hypothetical protein [Veronia pacifica]
MKKVTSPCIVIFTAVSLMMSLPASSHESGHTVDPGFLHSLAHAVISHGGLLAGGLCLAGLFVAVPKVTNLLTKKREHLSVLTKSQ